ncbi:hypothetical protein [Blautia sp. MSJ-19]|uniref:hypothetical protein n=1 Tax=Blautia sp. MSJ-19 TaxID=2841517 RepID=UPI001C0ECDA1|nr:hypothetical protein [Blautia sp. MSJ-19]MBU5480127.1 hypothetical protein [Blautia sp. MSJ-19]
MKKKKVQILSMLLASCMAAALPVEAAEFSSEAFVLDEAGTEETNLQEAQDEAADFEMEPEDDPATDADISIEADEEETDGVEAGDTQEEDLFSDAEQDEFISAEEASTEENLGGILDAGGSSSRSAKAVVEANIPASDSVTTTCTVYSGSNLEYQNYSVWSSPAYSYITRTSDGLIMRVQSGAIEGALLIEYYDTNYNLKKTLTLELTLPLFGAFYESGDNYYILTGDKNTEHSDSKEVYRLSKYSKSWTSQGSCSLYGANTAIPFDAGSARMVMNGKYIYVRTCHEMYNGHQANVTFSVDTSNMSVVDKFTGVWNTDNGYVSHSFNQFIQVDNGVLLGADHGDAYPRSIVALKYPTDISNGAFLPSYGAKCEKYTMFTYSGGGGNYTGASQGGFEYSDSSYLVAGNYDADDEGSCRNVFVSSVPKDGGTATIRYFSDYAGTGDSASTPHLVKTGANSFVLLWSSQGYVYYCALDGNGERAGNTYKMAGNLSDCVPSVINGKLIWYTWKNNRNTFYEINLSNLSANKAVRIENGHKFTYADKAENGYVTKTCKICGATQKAVVPTAVYPRIKTEKHGWQLMGDARSVENGKTYQMYCGFDTVDDDDAESAVDFEFTSSDESIFTVKKTAVTTLELTPVRSGVATLTIKATYNPEVEKKIDIYVDRLSDAVFDVTLINNLPYYNAKEHKPSAYISNSEQSLQEGTDFAVSYRGDLVNAGTATVIFTGIGRYTGTIERDFTIRATSIYSGMTTVELTPSVGYYNGKPQTPQVIIKYNDVPLVLNKDYTVEYANNIEIGTARVGVTGIGNFYGYFTRSFYIRQARPELTATLEADRKQVVSGGQVKLTAKASGGSGIYTYKFIVCDDRGNWYKLRDFESSSAFTWTTGASGKKTVYVDVKDSDGYVKRAELACEVTPKTVTNITASLSASPSAKAVSGSQVKLTAKASGGSGSYTYKFIVCDDKGNWYRLRDFGSSSAFTWTPGAAGKKTLYVDVKDSKGTVKRAALGYEITNKELTASLNVSPSGSAVSGTKVKLSAKANGGSGSYTYKFIVCDDKGNWYRLRDFGSSSEFTWTTGPAGKKNLYVDVKDSTGTVRRASVVYQIKQK